MRNPQIAFRLTFHQLAKGLKIIRKTEPNYQLTSLSKLVKALYINNLMNSSEAQLTEVTEKDIDEIRSLKTKKITPMNFTEFQRIAK